MRNYGLLGISFLVIILCLGCSYRLPQNMNDLIGKEFENINKFMIDNGYQSKHSWLVQRNYGISFYANIGNDYVIFSEIYNENGNRKETILDVVKLKIADNELFVGSNEISDKENYTGEMGENYLFGIVNKVDNKSVKTWKVDTERKKIEPFSSKVYINIEADQI